MKSLIEKAKQLIDEKLKDHPDRLAHCYGVAKTAKALAILHHVNPDAAEIAGLMHDYAKYDSLADQQKHVDLKLIDLYKDHSVIFHAYAAAHAVETLLDINDEAILSAIRCHVWGKPKMTTLEKVLFVADFCDPTRPFEDKDYIHELACNNLDQAVVYCMKSSIDELGKRHMKPSEESLRAYQYYKEVTSDVTR